MSLGRLRLIPSFARPWCCGLALACGLGAVPALAEGKLTPESLGHETAGPDREPIPGVVRKRPESTGGSIYVSVENARQLGNPQDPASLYCAVDVSVYNLTALDVRDLAVSVAYTGPAGSAGSSLSVFHEISSGDGANEVLDQLPTSSCRGLTGKATILACRTSAAEDCSGQVQGLASGAIPLQ